MTASVPLEAGPVLARWRNPKGRGARRALALGMALVALGCARKDQNARGTRSSPAGEGSSEATRVAFELASATPDTPLRPEQPVRLLPVHNGPGSAPEAVKGTVYVSTRKDDCVYALVDENGDHKVDRVSIVARGLDTPNGIAYRNGSLFIAEISRLWRSDEKHHGWRYIRFGPDNWLYIPIGAPCDVCQPEEPIFSTVSRVKPDRDAGRQG